jgi:hypothetical protein
VPDGYRDHSFSAAVSTTGIEPSAPFTTVRLNGDQQCVGDQANENGRYYDAPLDQFGRFHVLLHRRFAKARSQQDKSTRCSTRGE